MNLATGSQADEAIAKAEQQLLALLRSTGAEIGSVATDFERLASHTNQVMVSAASIVECIEGDSVRALLPKIEALGQVAKEYIFARLQATNGIVKTVTSEAELLERLVQLTRGQRSVARETQTLSVLTSIEVAHLGQMGAGFQYLARELAEFSQSVTQGTKDLAVHTDERRSSVEETRRTLINGLPRIQEEFARMESDLGSALSEASSSQEELLLAPARFRNCVEEIAGQITGVVAAVQSFDITRQQLEHVREALAMILEKLRAAEEGAEAGRDLPWCMAGLAIQIYQLKSTEDTVGSWVAQIGTCIDNILRISSSELSEIGPMVLQQESKLAAQLERIERLEEQCEKDNAEVQETFTGLSNLMQLVGEHVEQSKDVRDRLQLLTFNSIVEANHLGSKADTILEISQSIKRLSTDWSGMTDRSAQSMEEILSLVDQAREGMLAFSAEGSAGLHEAQEETKAGLQGLRDVAAKAAEKASEVEDATHGLKAMIATVAATKERLAKDFALIGAVMKEMEALQGQLQLECPEGHKHCNREEIEALYSATYTTEIEREVMRAALAGAPVPVMEQNLGGNDVELF